MRALLHLLLMCVALPAVLLVHRHVIGSWWFVSRLHWNAPRNRLGVLYRAAVRLVLAVVSVCVPDVGLALAMLWLYPAAQELASWWRYRHEIVTAPPVTAPPPAARRAL